MTRLILPRTKVGADAASIYLGPPSAPKSNGIDPTWVVIGLVGAALLFDYARGYRYTKR